MGGFFMGKRRVLTFSGILLLIIVFGVVGTMFFSKTLNSNNIAISEVIVEEKVVSIKGNLTDSATNYKEYKVSSTDNKLYIKIKGNELKLGKKDGSFDIVINSEKYGKIDGVYLQDETSDRKIWPK